MSSHGIPSVGPGVDGAVLVGGHCEGGLGQGSHVVVAADMAVGVVGNGKAGEQILHVRLQRKAPEE